MRVYITTVTDTQYFLDIERHHEILQLLREPTIKVKQRAVHLPDGVDGYYILPSAIESYYIVKDSV